jgi:hypothetical protein
VDEFHFFNGFFWENAAMTCALVTPFDSSTDYKYMLNLVKVCGPESRLSRASDGMVPDTSSNFLTWVDELFERVNMKQPTIPALNPILSDPNTRSPNIFGL